MSALADLASHLLDRWGPPERELPPVHPALVALGWPEAGPAGQWGDGFYTLFSAGLQTHDECLASWSFLLPGVRNATVFGRNAYGALLVAYGGRGARRARAGVLDPTTVRWWGPPNLDVEGLVGSWLLEKRLPWFQDTRAWEAWRKGGGRELFPDEIYAMQTPLGLGGTLAPDNFAMEEIVRYYATTGPIYRDALGA